jgi:hypothetical protein
VELRNLNFLVPCSEHGSASFAGQFRPGGVKLEGQRAGKLWEAFG